MLVHCEPFKGLGEAALDLSEGKKCPFTEIAFAPHAREVGQQGGMYAMCRIFYMVKKVEKKEFVDADYLLNHWQRTLNFTRPKTKEKLKEAHLFVMTNEKKGFLFKEKTTISLVTAAWKNCIQATSSEKTDDVLQAVKATLRERKGDKDIVTCCLKRIAKDFPEESFIYKDHLDFFLKKDPKENKRLLAKILFRFPTLENVREALLK